RATPPIEEPERFMVNGPGLRGSGALRQFKPATGASTRTYSESSRALQETLRCRAWEPPGAACCEPDQSAAFTLQRCPAAGRRWKDPPGFAMSTALRPEGSLKAALRMDFARAIANCMSRTRPERGVHADSLLRVKGAELMPGYVQAGI